MRPRWLQLTRFSAFLLAVLATLVGAFVVTAALHGFDPYAAVLLASVLISLALTARTSRRQFRVQERSVARLASRLARVDRRSKNISKVRQDLRKEAARTEALRQNLQDVAVKLDAISAEVDRRTVDVGKAVAGQLRHELRTRPGDWRREDPLHVARNHDGAYVEQEAELLRGSPLFDQAWYVERHPDASGDAALHYVRFGSRRGSDPHPVFYGDWYLERYPSSGSSLTPLGHFLEVGAAAGFDPHPLFASRWYADRYLDGHLDEPPVLHYLRTGWQQGCNPHPLFDAGWYRERHARWLDAREEPLAHFLRVGASLGLDPSPSVDVKDLDNRFLLSGSRDPLTTFLERDSLALAEASTPLGLQPPAGHDAMLDAKWEYLARRVYWRRPDAVLYRIIGNDLPPRHRAGQSLKNLRFILENEPELEGCEKRWVLNRITDRSQEAALMELLDRHGQSYMRIPFVEEEYRSIGWRFQDFARPGVTYSDVLESYEESAQRVALDHIYHDKNLYVMNNNGARNAALRDGRKDATWVLPWDGNCFLTVAAWEQFREAITSHPYAKYVIVPMARVLENDSLLDGSSPPKASEEPQVAFRFDAAEEFDDDARYGRRPKVRLFYRIGLKGVWDRWIDLPWERIPREAGPEAGQFVRAAWVARLFSGRADLEGNIRDRGVRRIEAIRRRIDAVDEHLARKVFSADHLFALSEVTLERQRARYQQGGSEVDGILRELTTEADRALQTGPFSVLDKTTVAPSGDPHDYWHPAPYWWPDPKTPDGRPYVRHDGERVPGTELGEAGSEQYDRTALQSMFDASFRLALAWYFTGSEAYATHGAALVRTWFIDPATRMNPDLGYAQARLGHDDDEGQPSGIIEFKDLYLCLDSVRLFDRAGAFTSRDRAALVEWLRSYRNWLRESWQGAAEMAAPNNHSTWYEVQVAAICAYLDDVQGLLEVCRRLEERRLQHFDAQGRQPHELSRTLSLHYSTYNLQGWLYLAQMGERVGMDLWQRGSEPKQPGMANAARYLLPYVAGEWPHRQDHPFNLDRLRVLAWECRTEVRREASRAGPVLPSAHSVAPVFSVHDGIRPFWQLGSPALDVMGGPEHVSDHPRGVTVDNLRRRAQRPG